MNDNEYTITQKEAADFLNVSITSISRYRKQGLAHTLIRNPESGKQEVRFRHADLERWNNGRRLLASPARNSEQSAPSSSRTTGGRSVRLAEGAERYLGDLLVAYQDQITLLREQVEEMREQLARRDRQIDDLIRLLVGLQPADTATAVESSPPMMPPTKPEGVSEKKRRDGLYEMVDLPHGTSMDLAAVTTQHPRPVAPHVPAYQQKIFSREELTRSILRLRARGKEYKEIARGLNRINVATLSGRPQWTVFEVQALLPALVTTSHICDEHEPG